QVPAKHLGLALPEDLAAQPVLDRPSCPAGRQVLQHQAAPVDQDRLLALERLAHTHRPQKLLRTSMLFSAIGYRCTPDQWLRWLAIVLPWMGNKSGRSR